MGAITGAHFYIKNSQPAFKMTEIYGFLCFFTCIGTAHIASRIVTIKKQPKNEINTLNSIKGILAISVFICHAGVWQDYIKTNNWNPSQSYTLNAMGEYGITFFFMMTGFFFGKKFIEEKGNSIDWVTLYTSRITRLYPVYFIFICTLFFITLIKSQQFNEVATAKNLHSLSQWIFFAIPGSPDINGTKDTNIITSGITWTLAFDWIFYFSFPFLAPLLGSKPSKKSMIFCTPLLAIVLYLTPFYGMVYAMLCAGVLCAKIVSHEKIKLTLQGNFFSVAMVALPVINSQINHDTHYSVSTVLVLSLSFLIASSGNHFFNLLKTKTLQILGTGAYAIYLFHGIFLYVGINLFQHHLGNYNEHSSDLIFWIAPLIISPCLIAFSIWVYFSIEAPATQKTALLSSKIKNFNFF